MVSTLPLELPAGSNYNLTSNRGLLSKISWFLGDSNAPLLSVMNDTTQLVPLNKQSIKTYDKAMRRLRRKVGAKAPTTVELINFELAGRDPLDIASCFLDHLRDLERHRYVEPGFKPGRRSVGKPRVPFVRATWPGRRPPVSMSDPTRN